MSNVHTQSQLPVTNVATNDQAPDFYLKIHDEYKKTKYGKEIHQTNLIIEFYKYLVRNPEKVVQDLRTSGHRTGTLSIGLFRSFLQDYQEINEATRSFYKIDILDLNQISNSGIYGDKEQEAKNLITLYASKAFKNIFKLSGGNVDGVAAQIKLCDLQLGYGTGHLLLNAKQDYMLLDNTSLVNLIVHTILSSEESYKYQTTRDRKRVFSKKINEKIMSKINEIEVVYKSKFLNVNNYLESKIQAILSLMLDIQKTLNNDSKLSTINSKENVSTDDNQLLNEPKHHLDQSPKKSSNMENVSTDDNQLLNNPKHNSEKSPKKSSNKENVSTDDNQLLNKPKSPKKSSNKTGKRSDPSFDSRSLSRTQDKSNVIGCRIV
ncbi:hypothetical protein BN7_5972 [Wickerhamomyces ciferrii]|uniref:Uncharacterized protein n=1 Tax=Wickerhamomyces ciferrii (strain ATCC 14091 / BCRC 22168 / CBS 111 / JCM 3599 / NBRC 0793 / NRRL Y-1031 F-60-10) TaxID=1206466 RepID=K0KY46_WICCF|nr:uncharacterized protein BN7_5972 [Wickerhamomyces ciferrii]CCH46379.1 hypothetical protein BN7_5972 [Wickerhamomyces ciferrii]